MRLVGTYACPRRSTAHPSPCLYIGVLLDAVTLQYTLMHCLGDGRLEDNDPVVLLRAEAHDDVYQHQKSAPLFLDAGDKNTTGPRGAHQYDLLDCVILPLLEQLSEVLQVADRHAVARHDHEVAKGLEPLVSAVLQHLHTHRDQSQTQLPHTLQAPRHGSGRHL